jgi:hypothetical protein
MRKTLSLGVAVAALALLSPSAAEAHHVDHARSGVACVLVGTTPTIQVVVALRQFEDWNKPVRYDAYVDGQLVERNSTGVAWPGPDYDLPWSHATTPGAHDVLFYVSWADYREHDQVAARVTCPAPPTPPPPPVPPPPPPVDCNGVSYPPGTTCPTPPPPCRVRCTPPPKRCVTYGAHYRVTVTPRHADHGQVTVRLVGPHTSHVRWYVDHVRHARGGHAWEHTTHHGRRWSVYLWVPSVWGQHLWGHHRITVTFDTPCGHRRVHRDYFNHDPISDEAQRELDRAFASSYGTG